MGTGLNITKQRESIKDFGERLNRKIHSIGYRRELFCYLLVEELLLLLNVPAIYVRTIGRANTKFEGMMGWRRHLFKEEVDADANVTQPELETLHREFKSDSKGVVEQIVTNGVTLRMRSDSTPFQDIQNGNLRDVDRNVDLQIKHGDLELLVRLWFSASVVEQRCLVLSSLLQEHVSWHFLLGELENARRVEAESLFAEQRDHGEDFDISSPNSDEANWFSRRKKLFWEEVKGSSWTEITTEYKKRFLPLVKIANRLRLACRHLASPDAEQVITDYVLMYRADGEDAISFLLSNKQLEKFSTGSIDEFGRILRWYYRVVGPSGYVLKTGHSEFCPDPKSDPRWSEYKSDAPGIRRLIRKLQSPDGVVSDDPDALYENTFIMPLCVQRSSNQRSLIGTTVDNNDIRLLVECRLPPDPNEQHKIRRRLFDLAWEFMPGIEAAITAQINTEKMISARDLRRQDLARWASLIHDLPKYVVQPTEVAVKNAAREFGFLCSEQGLSGVRVDRIEEELNRAIAKTEHAHYLLLLASPSDTRNRKPIELKHVTQQKLSEHLRLEGSRYVRSNLEYRYGDDTFHPLNEEDAVGLRRGFKDNIRFSLEVSDELPELEVPIYLLTTMVYNHVDNSLEELVENCGDKIADDSNFGLIKVSLSFESSMKCLRVTISDYGRGMDIALRKQKQKMIDRIIREGAYPELSTLRSTKAGNMGSGLFNNAIMLNHLNSDSHLGSNGSLTISDRSDGQEGLEVQLNVPVSVPTVAWKKRGQGYRRLSFSEKK